MEGIWILFSFIAGVAGSWFFTNEYHKGINKHLTDANVALKDQIFNITESKQIYNQLRLLFVDKLAKKPRKRPANRRKR